MKVSSKPILYIIDDDIRMLDALSWFAGENNIYTETYSNAHHFLEKFQPGHHGCVLSDINMPEIDGMELNNRLKQLDDSLPVILITGFASIPLAVEAMKNKVFDFIEKPIDNKILLATIRKAFAVNQEHYETQRNLQEQKAPLKRLTKREREVFNILISGHTNKVVAGLLNITDKTVEAHRSSIMRKTGSRSLFDLIELNKK